MTGYAADDLTKYLKNYTSSFTVLNLNILVFQFFMKLDIKYNAFTN